MNGKRLNNETLGQFIKKNRIALNMTTKDVASAASIPESTYIQYENGTVSVFIDHLVIFTRIFNVELRTFFDIYINPEKHG
ncbi:helix-turn-helix domain-containing protein [Providencia sp. Je.9.19]|uniref:helix-turn-helix domain-containing protein n=1 Tax=unclassified Providencia TaxID=2633465 RepID=UPI003DA9EE78